MIIALATPALTSCGSQRSARGATTDSEASLTSPVHAIAYGKQDVSFLPKAVIYQTNGDYNDNVTVTLSADRKSIVSYPAPSDITSNSSALPLKNGWLLDRRGGIGPNTAFLRYTYSEYARLKTAPSQSQLLEAIIPDAHVTRYAQLPVRASQAISSPESVMKYVPAK